MHFYSAQSFAEEGRNNISCSRAQGTLATTLNKTATSAAQCAKCILLHAYSRTLLLLALSCKKTNKNFIAYLTS